jgi:hypothetical protein
LDLVGGGTLDLNESALIVDYSGASPLPVIRERLISGRGGAGLGNGAWTGNGITSSAAATLNAISPESHAVGYADNAMLPLGSYTSFRGQPVDNTAILLAPTSTGDANLDGLVNDEEVTIVGAFYQPGAPGPHWQWGDFDYNGSIDDDDVTILGALYESTTFAAAAPQTAIGRITQSLGGLDERGDSTSFSVPRSADSGAAYFESVESEPRTAFGPAASTFRIAIADDERLLDMLARTIAAESTELHEPGRAGDRIGPRRSREIDALWTGSQWSR